MLSYRQTLQKSWLKSIVTGRTLAQILRVPIPTSITPLLNKLIKEPGTVDLTVNVVTGGLSGLGGQARLILNSDGTYKVHFHMWNTSKVTGYDYAVRAIFTTPAGMCLVSMHSGHVGAESLTGSAAQDDYEEDGIHPLMKNYWPDIVTGTLSEAHEYSASGGPLGELEDLAKEIIIIYTGGLAGGVAGSALGVTIALTSEAGKAFGGIGQTIAVIGGVAVFTIGMAAGATVGNALILATVAGVAAGAVTDLTLVKQRQLQQNEYDFVNSGGSGGSNFLVDPTNASVFMGWLPPIQKLWITNLCSPDNGRAFTVRGTDGNIYLNLGAAFDHAIDPAGQSPSYPHQGQLFIHELVHAMQIDHGSTWGVICSGIVNQAKYTFGDDVYKFGAAGPDWHSSYFNNESRAAIVDTWFANGMNTKDPYYMYIKNNVRTGDMGTVDV